MMVMTMRRRMGDEREKDGERADIRELTERFPQC